MADKLPKRYIVNDRLQGAPTELALAIGDSLRANMAKSAELCVPDAENFTGQDEADG